MEIDKKNRSEGGTARRILIILLISTLVLAGLHLLLQALNLEVYHQQHGQFYELSNRFDLDDEASVPTWFSLVLFLLISVGAAFARYLEKNKDVRRVWGLVALIALLFSIDEASGLHEFALQTLHVMFYQEAAPTESSNAWLLVAPFVLAAGLWMLWKMFQHFPRRTMILFGISGVIFLTGAMGIDLIISINERETFLNQGLMVAAEETLELLGMVMVCYTIADYIEQRHGRRFAKAVAQLRQG